MNQYPKRLIEVDLPIKRISAHARREKSIRQGHISTLHIWWARRPLAACRAVLCAALWLDPADENCLQAFRDATTLLITNFARQAATSERLSASCSPESLGRWLTLAKPEGRIDPTNATHLNTLRYAILDFIADFANWDNSTLPEYLETARMLTWVSHAVLSDPSFKFQISDFKLTAPDGFQFAIDSLKSKIANHPRSLVVDPFAGGGAIPLEALRVGADAFASDLNPVAVLLNKVVLEYIPKYGQQLADEVRKWGNWIKEQAEKELAEFYPKDPDGATPIAYLWARTITCEGPGCGAEVPLMRGTWLAKKGKNTAALKIISDTKQKRISFEIVKGVKAKQVSEGTVRNGSATCPICNYTTPNSQVRAQLTKQQGGAANSRLIAVVTTHPAHPGRSYRLATNRDRDISRKAREELQRREKNNTDILSLVPDEIIAKERPSPNARGLSAVTRMGMNTFGDLFTPRQLLGLTTIARLIRDIDTSSQSEQTSGLKIATKTCLALNLSKLGDLASSLGAWEPNVQTVQHIFGRQALPICWDFAEGNLLGESRGSWFTYHNGLADLLSTWSGYWEPGQSDRQSATEQNMPDDSVNAFVTDPPYYDAIPYADLSDFFYVWLRRSIQAEYPDLFASSLTPKDEEAIWNPSRIYSKTGKPKDELFYESQMTKALAEGRRITIPSGIGVVVFAHKSTAGWEAILSALVEAGWIATASWPIDTELGTRMNAMETASLSSSIHVICRPRADRVANQIENQKSANENIGDWRDVLAELPQRIHTWMPRLAAEGVVGADAIFACLGPALEIFSQYARVEKASGEQVTLKEYLEYVWAAVAKEALTMIFTGADTTGFEEDARLTAMWLWTLSTSTDEGDKEESEDETESDEEEGGKSAKLSGYTLEYDAARKIAQGLGAHLEQLTNLVDVKGDKARLLPVSQRARHLFGKDEGKAPAPTATKRKQAKQLDMFKSVEEVIDEADDWGEKNAPPPGVTVLDRVHQAMILFAAGRGDALKRFLVDNGAGSDQRFWRLAQAFSALYPASSDEKRWVDGVLARKKGLGF